MGAQGVVADQDLLDLVQFLVPNPRRPELARNAASIVLSLSASPEGLARLASGKEEGYDTVNKLLAALL
jgi:hypothetical protein